MEDSSIKFKTSMEPLLQVIPIFFPRLISELSFTIVILLSDYDDGVAYFFIEEEMKSFVLKKR